MSPGRHAKPVAVGRPAPCRARPAARRRCRIRSSCSATTTASSTPIRRPRSSSRCSQAMLKRQQLADVVAFGCPLLSLVEQVRRTGTTVNEYGVEIVMPRVEGAKLVDVFSGALPDQPGLVLVMLQQRSMAQMIERQLTHRAAARSVSGMAAVLAHEIKNPLSGIRGAAQLLEPGVSDEDRALTQLICAETDRIRKLVDRMEVFGDERPLVKRAGQHPRRARSRAAAGRERLCQQHPDRLRVRPLAAAGAGQSRQADPGVPQPRQECRRGDRRDRRAGPHRTSTPRSGPACGCRCRAAARASRCR